MKYRPTLLLSIALLAGCAATKPVVTSGNDEAAAQRDRAAYQSRAAEAQSQRNLMILMLDSRIH